MADWQRLGKYVVARRVELGFKTRSDFAAAVHVTSRTLGDIENGRRGNFDAVTIASLEKALGWETGSVQRIAGGGEPVLRGQAPASANPMDRASEVDEIELIAGARSLTAGEKLQAIRTVLLLRQQAEEDDRRAAEQASADADEPSPRPSPSA